MDVEQAGDEHVVEIGLDCFEIAVRLWIYVGHVVSKGGALDGLGERVSNVVVFFNFQEGDHACVNGLAQDGSAARGPYSFTNCSSSSRDTADVRELVGSVAQVRRCAGAQVRSLTPPRGATGRRVDRCPSSA